MPAHLSEHRLAGQRGQLAADVGLEEGAEAHAEALEAMHLAPEGWLVAGGANDDVWVCRVRVEEVSGRLDGGVAGLDGLLRGRRVFSDDDVQVRDLRHDAPHLNRGMLSPGLEPGRTGV